MSEGVPGFVWADTGSIRLMVHGEAAPTDEEWERFLKSTVREVDGKWVASERTGALIYSRGGMATPRQRNQLKKISLNPERMPTLVLMTDSRFSRGVATAIGWVVPSLRDFHAFALHQVNEAAEKLTSIPSEQAEFKEVLQRLLGHLDGESPEAIGQVAS